MCGIAGVIGPAALRPDRVERTLWLMRNRGPDAAGSFAGTVGEYPVALLHTRLSIIDLDPRSDQPFTRDGLTLVYNGEIYNYRELRGLLEGLGHRFTTASDTEVIIEAYRAWGPACVERFNGMWAFALLDKARGTLMLSRDRFGEKPLFYVSTPDGLAFGSEVKLLHALTGQAPEPDLDRVARYLVYGYRAVFRGGCGWYRDIHELPAGASLVLTGPEPAAPDVWWRLEHRPHAMSREEAVAGTRERLTRAMELRLRSDVPVAFCLSGGVDSVSLASIAAREFDAQVHTFSILDKDPRYDERDDIDVAVASIGCDPVFVRTSTDGFLDRMGRIVAYHDAPVITISYYVHNFLSEEIHRRGFKVAISGTGADELFTGYYDHYLYWLATQKERPDFGELVDDWRAGMGAHIRNPALRDPRRFVDAPQDRAHLELDSGLFQELVRVPVAAEPEDQSWSPDILRNRMLHELAWETVPPILREDDLNSMEYSVENRSPYLDHELAEFAFSIPSEHLAGCGMAKQPLREAVAGLVPDPIRLNCLKRGFNASINSMLDRTDPSVAEYLMAPGPIFDIVDRDGLERLIRANDFESNSLSKFLFSFVSARMFLDHADARQTAH